MRRALYSDNVYSSCTHAEPHLGAAQQEFSSAKPPLLPRLGGGRPSTIIKIVLHSHFLLVLQCFVKVLDHTQAVYHNVYNPAIA